MDILTVNRLSKRFGDVQVLRGLSFSVPEHTVFGFLGQNGAGKTTTMKLILGLLRPDEGTITVCGEEVCPGSTPTNRFIGYLPDVPAFYGYMKPREYLNLCGEISGLSPSDCKTRSDRLLELVGLSGKNKRIGGFSRGMKQRLGIAQALLHEPRLLICDEPTSALDPIGRKEILDILSEVRGKTTVLFSTHILSDAERICDEVAVLHDGALALSGSLTEIKANHRHGCLHIRFATAAEATRLVQAPQLARYAFEPMQDGTVLSLKTPQVEEAEAAIISALSTLGLLPLELGLEEPTLETLFLEAVQ